MVSIPADLLTLLLILLLIFPNFSTADHSSPELSPGPSPFPGGRAFSLFKATSYSFPPSSSPSPSSDISPDLSPHHPLHPPLSAPFFEAEPASHTVAAPPSDLIEGDDEIDLQSNAAENERSSSNGGGGMSGGKKAAVGIAAVVGVAVVGIWALVYKKRRENVIRARYGYATRRDLL